MRPSRTIGDLLYNFHWVVPGEAARAMQAWAGGLETFLARRGIRAIINLRGRNADLNWWKREIAITQGAGIVHLDAMLDSRKIPTQEMLIRLFEAFDTAPRPFLLKCSGGQDRTSLAAALYILHRDGWAALETARAQFSRFPYLHFPKQQQRWLKAFLDFAQHDAGGLPVAEWARSRYAPQAAKSWFDNHGLADGYVAVFTVATRSPRQW